MKESPEKDNENKIDHSKQESSDDKKDIKKKGWIGCLTIIGIMVILGIIVGGDKYEYKIDGSLVSVHKNYESIFADSLIVFQICDYATEFINDRVLEDDEFKNVDRVYFKFTTELIDKHGHKSNGTLTVIDVPLSEWKKFNNDDGPYSTTYSNSSENVRRIYSFRKVMNFQLVKAFEKEMEK